MLYRTFIRDSFAEAKVLVEGLVIFFCQTALKFLCELGLKNGALFKLELFIDEHKVLEK